MKWFRNNLLIWAGFPSYYTLLVHVSASFLKIAQATLTEEHPQSLRETHVYLITENYFSVFHWHPVVRQRGFCGKQKKSYSSQVQAQDISQ